MAKFVRIMGDDSGDTVDVTGGRLNTDTEFTGTITVGEVRGMTADGVAPTDNPVLIAGYDGTLTQTALTDSSGRFHVVGPVADGVAPTADPVLIAGYDGTLTQTLLTDSSGRQMVVGAVVDEGSVTGVNPILIAGTDGSDVFRLRTDDAGFLSIGFNSKTHYADAITTANVQSVGDDGGTGILQQTASHVFNGTTYDRQRGNTEITGLASAARTTDTNSAALTNYNGKGLAVLLDVTTNPGSAETLQLIIQGQDAESTTWYDLTSDAAQTFGGGAGTRVHHVYPGIGSAAAGIDAATSVLLPRTYRVRVVHSAEGEWTYSVGVSVVL
jgi:hypothetical protein